MVFNIVLYAFVLALPLLSVNGKFTVFNFEITCVQHRLLAASTKRSMCSDGRSAAINSACCAVVPVVEDIVDNLFTNECGDSAHGALRLLFHDAIGISPTAGCVCSDISHGTMSANLRIIYSGGGADGSIATFNATELTFPANLGIDDILDDLGPFLLKHSNVLSAGDL